MARAYSAQHKTDEAIAAYRRAIALNDQDAWSMNNLGLLFLEQGFAEDAVPYLARAVEMQEERAGVPQQPRHGARTHGTFRRRGRGVQGRAGR